MVAPHTHLHPAPCPVPLGQQAHPSRAGRWPPSPRGPSRSSCRRLLTPGSAGSVLRAGWVGLLVSEGRGPPGGGPGEQRGSAAQMGVLAPGPAADSSPGASPSRRPAWAVLATRLCWFCRHRLPQVPVPPAPGSGINKQCSIF